MEKTVRYDSFGELYSAISESFEIVDITHRQVPSLSVLHQEVLIASAKTLCPTDYRLLRLQIRKGCLSSWNLTAEDFFFVNRLYFYREKEEDNKDRTLHLDIVTMGSRIEEIYLGTEKEFVKNLRESKKSIKEHAKKGCQIVIGKDYFTLKKPLSRKQTDLIKDWNLGEIVEICLRK